MKLKHERFVQYVDAIQIATKGDLIVYLKDGGVVEYNDCDFIDREKELYCKTNLGYLSHIPKENIMYYSFKPKGENNE